MGYSGRFTAEIGAIGRMGQLAHSWDGHSSDAAPKGACQKAAQFLQRVEEKYGYMVDAPTVGAVPGGVVLIWRPPKGRGRIGNLERELEVIFTDRGNEWAASDRNGLEPTMSGEDVDPDALLKIIDHFVVA